MVKSKIYNNIAYVKSLKQHSKKKVIFKAIAINNLHFSRSFRSITFFYCSSKFKYFPSFYKTNCFVTGRSRAVIAKLIISRLTFKNYAIAGVLSGFFPSRW